MPSPAERQAAARAEVERIAAALAHEIDPARDWAALAPYWPREVERWVRNLLLAGVIKPGDRPAVNPPMEGQTTIDDYT